MANAANCDVTLSRHIVDYGHIPPPEGSAHRQSQLLEENDIVVSALCSEPQSIGLFFNSGGGRLFTFGDRGVVALRAIGAALDGHSVMLGKAASPGVLRLKSRARGRRTVLNGDGLLPVKNGEIQRGQLLTVILKIQPLLDTTSVPPDDIALLETQIAIWLVTQ